MTNTFPPRVLNFDVHFWTLFCHMLLCKFAVMIFVGCEDRKGPPFDENVEIMVAEFKAVDCFEKLKHILLLTQKYQ